MKKDKNKRILSLLLCAVMLTGGLFAQGASAPDAESPASDPEPAVSDAEPSVPDEEPAAPDAAPETAETEETTPAGDADLDGDVDAYDARLALRIAVGLEPYHEEDAEYAAADVDGSGKVDASDARWILRAAVGLETAGHVHKYVNAYCTVCNKLDPLHYPVRFQTDFERILYETAHPLINMSSDQLPANTGTLMETAYYRLGKWCCYYTIHHVFRPALEKAGYSPAQINHIAPNSYDSKRLANGLLVANLFSIHVPSLLMDYYLTHPEYCKAYVMHEFADDVVTNQIYARSEDADSYTPKVGDVLFLTNKSSTWVQGYPTVDHTAQIIQVYADGSFWCTEGSIINRSEDPVVPRVREMMYFYSEELGTYKHRYSNVDGEDLWMVLMAAQPDLTK